MLDVVTFGEPMVVFCAREPGHLADATTFTKAVAGAETNVATGLARLKLNVGFITKLGHDSFGDYLLKAMQQEGIAVDKIVRSNQLRTGIYFKAKAISGDPDIEYLRAGSAASQLNINELDVDYLCSARHLHATSIFAALNPNTYHFTQSAMQLMRKAGKTISFDPNLRPTLWSSQDEMINKVNQLACLSDWFLPGIAEGRLLSGLNSAEQIAEFYLSQGIPLVVIKLGPEGAFYASAQHHGYVRGFPVEKVVDTVGAGDGFAVGIISGLLSGLSFEQAVRRANAIGALQVMSPGDSDGLPPPEQLKNYLAAFDD